VRFSISSWSLHGLLSAGAPLIELPRQFSEHGIFTAEICHFHFPKTDSTYLRELKSEFESNGVETYSILIDTGDIASPDLAVRSADIETIRGWIDVAAQFGAERVRISAGGQPPTTEAIARSCEALGTLYEHGKSVGVAVITENWQVTGLRPGPLLQILNSRPELGLCADTGNAEGADKYETLMRILPRATSMHFKARYRGAAVDLDDAARVFKLAEDAEFEGPVSLIYGDTTNEWNRVDEMREALEAFVLTNSVATR